MLKLTPLLKMESLDMIWVAVEDRARPTRARHARARISSASVSGVWKQMVKYEKKTWISKM